MFQKRTHRTLWRPRSQRTDCLFCLLSTYVWHCFVLVCMDWLCIWFGFLVCMHPNLPGLMRSVPLMRQTSHNDHGIDGTLPCDIRSDASNVDSMYACLTTRCMEARCALVLVTQATQDSEAILLMDASKLISRCLYPPTILCPQITFKHLQWRTRLFL
jgi:hypothetical protein